MSGKSPLYKKYVKSSIHCPMLVNFTFWKFKLTNVSQLILFFLSAYEGHLFSSVPLFQENWFLISRKIQVY